MKDYKIIVGGITKEFDNVAHGFAEAEKRAFELHKKYFCDYPDVTVTLFEKSEPIFLTDKYLALKMDCFGELYWRWAKRNDYGLFLFDLLNEADKEYLEELRYETDVHLSDLSFKQLKQLRNEIRSGSLYLSDYENSFNIDRKEVYDYAEYYEDYLEESGREDTPRILLFVLCKCNFSLTSYCRLVKHL